LKLLNLHASHGKEKYWVSQVEYQRLAGIELVQNRIHMAAYLGADVVIVHVPSTQPPEARPKWLEQTRKSLDQVEPFALSHNVRLAVENMAHDDWQMLDTLLTEYDPEFLGLCFDSGHANLGGDAFSHLERLKSRLIAVHLHDNDGAADQHCIPFTGSVAWEKLTEIIASSAYGRCANLEVMFRDSGYQDEAAFLEHAYAAGEQLNDLIESKRIQAGNGPLVS
jgi:sugar phosphate isomerase/epimerase